ncbi:hypothetical protein MCUN1_000386 [Malassezia cuniculi]|uniref:Uncharacterized protein n=1 Tax=Malassezia cuniculi TaxID=948313 RepID=A0AAF0EN35_9BASI|nr:hypothetical protein MCUN1_000386 [Malassezia cuniculi]
MLRHALRQSVRCAQHAITARTSGTGACASSIHRLSYESTRLFAASSRSLQQDLDDDKEAALLDAADRIARRSEAALQKTIDDSAQVTLELLDRLRPRELPMGPSKMSSVGYEMRLRRAQWNKVFRDVCGSFSLDQLVSLAKQAGIPRVTRSMSKRTVSTVLLEQYFHMKNPSRVESLGTQKGTRRELPVEDHEMFLISLQNEALLDKTRNAGVKVSFGESESGHSMLLTGPFSGVEDIVSWLSDFKQSVSTATLANITVPEHETELISRACRCYVRTSRNATFVSYTNPQDFERARIILHDYSGSVHDPILHIPQNAQPIPFAPPGALSLVQWSRLSNAPHSRWIGSEEPLEIEPAASQPGWDTHERADFGHVVFPENNASDALFIPGVPPACLDMSGPLTESVRLMYHAQDGNLLEATYNVQNGAFEGANWLQRSRRLVPVPHAPIDMRLATERRRPAASANAALESYADVLQSDGHPPVPLVGKRAQVPISLTVDNVNVVLWRAERVVAQRIPYGDATLLIEEIRRESMPGFSRRASLVWAAGQKPALDEILRQQYGAAGKSK